MKIWIHLNCIHLPLAASFHLYAYVCLYVCSTYINFSYVFFSLFCHDWCKYLIFLIPSSSFPSYFIDIKESYKNRRICSLIGVEGGHSLGGSLGVLRTFYNLGVRYMTLTSTCHTPWADSSDADAPKYNVKHGGLTAYGKVSLTFYFTFVWSAKFLMNNLCNHCNNCRFTWDAFLWFSFMDVQLQFLHLVRILCEDFILVYKWV